MNRDRLEEALRQLPLYRCEELDPRELEFSDRVRTVCERECPMYGRSWACPPGVGTVAQCRERCLRYPRCLLISSLTEVSDLSNLRETLSTRMPHEALTDQVGELLRREGCEVYILSTEACALCSRCTFPDGPCRHPERMHPCVESHGINLIPTMERLGMAFQFGGNVVSWVSLLFYKE